MKAPHCWLHLRTFAGGKACLQRAHESPPRSWPSVQSARRFARTAPRQARWGRPQSSGGVVQQGFVLWFTGYSGAGKSTVAGVVLDKLRARDVAVELLDG